MSWINKIPQYGDQIRVNRGLYFHYGIYIDDSHIVAFGAPHDELNPESAQVMLFTLRQFLKQGILEVREYSSIELTQKRNAQDIVNYAMMSLGRKGYNLITYNCEHFANECVFDKPKSEQVNKVSEAISHFFSRGIK